MATVKVKFRPSTVEGRPGSIVYFVTHRRVVRRKHSINSPFHSKNVILLL